MMRFVSLYQLPMVGSDVCGFNDDTNPILCSRWAVLGAWNPFYRNHADISAMRQEFFLWPMVADAARGAIATRYRLLDYMYTNLYTQNQTGYPMLTPLLWQYPEDSNVYSNELQFFHGEALMVSPVTEPNSTSVTFYMPKDTFYDFDTFEKVEGQGVNVTRDDVSYSQIPVHIRGGNVLPMRINSAKTTNAVRNEDFELIIAPGADGKANGTLYLDDGESVIPQETSLLQFSYVNGKLAMEGTFGYNPHVKIAQITLLDAPKSKCKGYNATSGALVTKQNLSLMKKFSVDLTKC
jgi:alpha-glucosidase